jgi:hypothetical protein
MRLIVSLVVCGCLTSQVAAFQARGATSGTPRISACSLITPDLAATYIHKQILPYLKPDEEPVGAIGTHCEYGRIGLQVNPFGSGTSSLRKSPGKEWQALSGIGETAFFRANGSQYAELMVWTGPNHFTIQLGVATGATMEATKAEAIALANAIIPKLR